MVAQHTVQTSFLSGVLSPSASARVDTDAYQQGMLLGVNVTPIHLGGVRRRGGLRYRAKCPYQLTRVTSVTITAPHGGTTANANDDDESTVLTTTDTVGTTDPFVVVHYDLGSAANIQFADAIGISIDADSSTQFAIQYSTDDSSWTTLGSALETVDTTANTYRRGGNAVSARYWRVARVGATDLGLVHVSLAGFNLWTMGTTMSAGREIGWEVSTEERYMVVLTDRTATIFNGDSGAFIAYVPMPYASADLSELDAATNAESMILVHGDYAPRFITRQTATNFQNFEAEFDNIPQFDFADFSSPAPTSDIQTIVFDTNWQEGDTFQVSLGGARTGEISYAGDVATTATNTAREVQKLWTVQAFSGVSCERTGTRTFVLTFADASADAYDQLSVTAIKFSGTAGKAAVTHTQTGVSRREPMWSATRGYPRTVEYFEGRLYFGGTRSKQQSLIGSEVNNILDMQLGEGLDDEALLVTLQGRQLNAINGLFAGRSFQQFTTGGEFRYVKEQGVGIVPNDSPVNQTQYGSAKIKPVGIDGATIFVQRNRNSIRDFRFDYTENAYTSLGVSSLAPHLIYDVQDLAAWNGSAVDEINLVLVVNGVNPSEEDDAFPDGTLAVFNSRKEANVQAWTIWQTQGEFKAVATVLQEIFVLVKRTIDGVDGLYFEQVDDELYTDCAVSVENVSPTNVVTGLDHLNGEDCRAKADGFILQNVTPSAGSATIEMQATAVEIGLDWQTIVRPMPLQTFGIGGSTNLMRKRRVVHIRARVRRTLGLRVNDRELPDRYYDVDSFDEAATPFTGTHEIEESTNWDQKEDKLVTFSQVDPLPMEILGIDVQLEVTN